MVSVFNYNESFTLESGESLPGFHLAYTTHGKLNAEKNKAYINSCFFSTIYSNNKSFNGIHKIIALAVRYFQFYIIVHDDIAPVKTQELLYML